MGRRTRSPRDGQCFPVNDASFLQFVLKLTLYPVLAGIVSVILLYRSSLCSEFREQSLMDRMFQHSFIRPERKVRKSLEKRRTDGRSRAEFPEYVIHSDLRCRNAYWD